MSRLLLALALVPIVFAVNGFDADSKLSVSTFNCLSKSGYAFYIGRVYDSNGIIDSFGVQNIVNARKAGWTDVDTYMFPCLYCTESAAKQTKEAIAALQKAGAVVGTFWVDVEVLQWSPEHKENRAFITSIVNTAQSMNYTVGIYTDSDDWGRVVGNWNQYADLKLWWFSYTKGTANFVPFGGWKKPYIHQLRIEEGLGSCGQDITFDYK